MRTRRFVGLAAAGICGVIAIFALAACDSDDDSVATATSAPATSAAGNTPGTTPTGAATAGTTPAATPSVTAGATQVSVTEGDFKITMDKDSVPAGKVSFNIQNNGPSTHEFVIFKTDLAPDQLPVNPDDYTVNEDAAGLTHIDEAEDIAPNTSTSLSVDLAPGRYVLICNLPAHYQQGMRAGFSVQ